MRSAGVCSRTPGNMPPRRMEERWGFPPTPEQLWGGNYGGDGEWSRRPRAPRNPWHRGGKVMRRGSTCRPCARVATAPDGCVAAGRCCLLPPRLSKEAAPPASSSSAAAAELRHRAPGPETTKPRCRGASQAAAGLTADDGVERTLPSTIEGTTTESPWRWAGARNGARRPRVPCLRNPPRHQAPENDDDQVSLRLCRIRAAHVGSNGLDDPRGGR